MKNPMCVEGTPLEHYPELGLWVKREDLCCPPGPHFSKTRGVYAHIKNRPEAVIGCLDTSHSQGGWATAQACKLLGKKAVVFYPETVKMRRDGYEFQEQQLRPRALGASLAPLQAGRSAVLYHAAKKKLRKIVPSRASVYMMPNALKLPEMIDETVAEVLRTPLPPVDLVIVSASSGTIAAGVISGLTRLGYTGGIVVHQGYSRPAHTIRNYMATMVAEYSNRLLVAQKHPHQRGDVDIQLWREDFTLVDEGYSYGDSAPAIREDQVPFPSNKFYDRKALWWWLDQGRKVHKGEVLLWNIG
jgi:1-aminocyclopropane-1-carboxylate deaminase/D-cysteine desulfhydrase-like pyridoxal-dependent ACC family enzyme